MDYKQQRNNKSNVVAIKGDEMSALEELNEKIKEHRGKVVITCADDCWCWSAGIVADVLEDMESSSRRMADVVSAAVMWRTNRDRCLPECDCDRCILIRSVDKYQEVTNGTNKI
jgi:Zn-finger protein